ncbi:MAG: hypothetical protein GC160_08415 [Acidobacteria bacterium]|nr:hypothetical protein [Acidobacteriota bacterium]
MSTVQPPAVELPPVSTRAWKKNPGSDIVLPIAEKRRWVLGVWGACIAYAILRYNIFGPVEWIHLPSFVINKSFGLGAVVFLSCSYLVGKWIKAYPSDPKRRRSLAKFLGLTGLYFAGLHIMLSLALLSPAYYGKFYIDGGKMNLMGEVTFLFGALAIGFLMFPAITTLPLMYEALGGERWQRMQRMGYWALAMLAGHTFTMGWSGWLEPAGWHGGMPPISVWAFAFAVAALVAKAVSKPKAR